jgi:hypothetical protein
VGQAYRVALREVLPELHECLTLQQPSGLGLTLETHTGQITGTPLLAGDFNLELTFNSKTSAARQTCRLSLAVIQDPKNLWKNVPSNPQGLFARPDSWSGQQRHLLAASKRGRSHAHVGSYRDDDCAIAHLACGWSLLVAADGAGSAHYSRRGAELICRSAQAYLSQQLHEARGLDACVQAFASARTPQNHTQLHRQLTALLGGAAHQALLDIQADVAQTAAAQLKDYASTALIGLYRPFAFGTLCACYWVGDGAAAVYRQGREVIILGAADAGEYAGQTRFLDASTVTHEAQHARTQFALVEDLTAFILMTDGVSDPKFDTETNLHSLPLWDALWAELAPLTRTEDAHLHLLSWLDFWSQGNHDDRTLVLAVPSA